MGLRTVSVDDCFRAMFENSRSARDAQTNATATATLTAIPGHRNRVQRVSITWTGTATAAVALVRSGTTTKREIQIPATANGHIEVSFGEAGLQADSVNQSMDVTCPALGAGIVGRVFIQGYHTPEGD